MSTDESYASSAGYADATIDEWFNACSVGGTRLYPYGSTVDYDYCNSKNSGYGSAIHVGTLMACTNTYGTFDMSGNVSEWENSCSGSEGGLDTCRVSNSSFNTLDPRCSVSEGFQRQAANEMVGIRCCDD